jgi:large subunit ribosomal protein L13
VDTLSYKTISNNRQTAEKRWVIVDAENQVLGRLAARVAMVIRGKHKPGYTPHADCGDNVIVINAAKVRLTGNKMNTKTYRKHSGYPGGQRELPIRQQLLKKPGFPVEEAVRGMLPKNRLGRSLFKNLRVFGGSEHNHEAQSPMVLNLNDIK